MNRKDRRAMKSRQRHDHDYRSKPTIEAKTADVVRSILRITHQSGIFFRLSCT
jgi:hypothetical protein